MSPRRAFTLAEMLVVIAMIAILAALLFPVLSSATERAKRAGCINNVRQINTGVLMYAHDNADTLPRLPVPNPYPNGEGFFFKELMKSYVGLSGPPRPGDKLFICPSETSSPVDGLPSTFNLVDYSDYYFDAWLTGQKLTSVKHPSLTALVTETSAEVGYSWHQPQTKYYLVINPPYTAVGVHHAYNDALNEVSYVDSHINYIKIYNNGLYMSGMYNPIPGYDYQWSRN